MLGVLAELQLHRSTERRVAGQGQGGLGPVAARVDQGAKPETLEPLSHRAPVPAQRARRRLHVEARAAQSFENGGVAAGVVSSRLAGRKTQIFDSDRGSVGEGQGLAKAIL